MSTRNDFEDVPLSAEELALAQRWATSQIGRPSTRTDTQPLSQRKATVLIYRLLATIETGCVAEKPTGTLDVERLAQSLDLSMGPERRKRLAAQIAAEYTRLSEERHGE